ncbi:recombinase family protein [Bradyrhizobium sp. CCGUVB1N3]|uniref:recombinase family protein n=1 Tax=Bradyrhizobium sp. CCGUVB1N3 TaxID=2949629 RepID=UPI0020B275C3|nr:recombinase family protein [Bradyrhizobium sp. CCGUVB1N3]MCP3476664.1 recombinase family protein [Bradyrhizobium sp. CCGUVB1N3]
MVSDKVRPHHLERKAILYVRQSSAHRVLHNRESSALQYAMRDRLTALGWSKIEVIDDDLGRSAAGSVQRAGSERMVAEVCLGKVGAVCAREVSRFARNSRDWQQPTDDLNANANSDSTQGKLTLSRFLPHSELT